MGLVRFMATGLGRGIRAVAGLALIGYGLMVMKGTGGYVLCGLGVVFLASGVFNFCGLALLLGAPFWGKDLDKAT